jgi:hypothetical protein
MLKQMKKTLDILLAVCFVMYVTVATVSAEKISTESESSKNTTMFNEISTNITMSSGMDNNTIASNEIAMKKVVAMKSEDGKEVPMEK